MAAFALSAGLTPVVRASARACGAIAKPKADRWHKKPTALLGGIAIFVAVVLVAVVFAPRSAAVGAVTAG
ncbi:MAG: hypothetical protein KY475_15770, partial [Planctomycetes bacterium]|nr:hypothetical protein [Planctomycetota bacterium]